MTPVHIQILQAVLARTDAARDWRFRLADVVRALPHLNPGTVRTHVASRCCTNAPSNHQSRYPYFQAAGGGVYRVESALRKRTVKSRRACAWQDRLLSAMDSGVDPTLIDEALKLTPTERLENMRRGAESLDTMRS
jgi:hypothetical protein